MSQQDEQLQGSNAKPRRRQVYHVSGRPGPDNRPCMPPGHPSSWDLINANTVLAGEPYPADVPGFLGRRK